MVLKAIWKKAVVALCCMAACLSSAPALALAETPVGRVTISGITTPVAGDLPQTTVTLSENVYCDQALWYEMDENGYYQEFFDPYNGLSHDYPFKDGGCYALNIRIKPVAGYTLDNTDIVYDGTVLEEKTGAFLTSSHIVFRIVGDEVTVRIVFDEVEAPDNTDNGYSVVCVNALSIRDAPNGNRIGGYSFGDFVQVASVDGEWSEVYYDGETAWVKSEFLLRTYNPLTAVAPTKYTVLTNAVNVRKNILVESERIGGLTQGDELYVTGWRGNNAGELWFVVDYEGQLGYVRSDLVTPAGEEPQTAPAVFDSLIQSILLNFTGSVTPSTTAKPVIYGATAEFTEDCLRANEDGSYEIVIIPDDGYDLSDIVSPEDITLSLDGYTLDSVIAHNDGSRSLRMIKRDTDEPTDPVVPGDPTNPVDPTNPTNPTNPTGSTTSATTNALPKTGDESPVLYISLLMMAGSALCFGVGLRNRKHNEL